MQHAPIATTPSKENSHSCGPKWLTVCITDRIICDTFRDPRDDWPRTDALEKLSLRRARARGKMEFRRQPKFKMRGGPAARADHSDCAETGRVRSILPPP